MIKINGRPDTEEIARLIVIKTVNESLVKYHGTRISNDELKELTGYVKGQLEEIIKEVEPKETTIFEDGADEVFTTFYECTACGSVEIQQGFRYCPNCGKKIERILSQEEAQEIKAERKRLKEQEQEEAREERRKESEKTLKERLALQRPI